MILLQHRKPTGQHKAVAYFSKPTLIRRDTHLLDYSRLPLFRIITAHVFPRPLIAKPVGDPSEGLAICTE